MERLRRLVPGWSGARAKPAYGLGRRLSSVPTQKMQTSHSCSNSPPAGCGVCADAADPPSARPTGLATRSNQGACVLNNNYE